jgi:uncharacterized protein (DUF1810 family)
MEDPFDLQRFVDAQDPVYVRVCGELRAAEKRSHWMWFVFPQIAGLGGSPMAVRYAIASIAEAQAYLRHVVLGPRLRECTELLNAVEGRSIHEIFGSPDDLKFRSCMTLFGQASGDDPCFRHALHKYFNGQPDRRTLDLLGV